MSILILENDYNDLVKSLFPLGNCFKLEGYEVHYACPFPEHEYIHNILISRRILSILNILIN